jgi:hypothetical protein
MSWNFSSSRLGRTATMTGMFTELSTLWQGLLHLMIMILTPSLCSVVSQHNTMTVSLLLWKILSFLQLVKYN